jgi:23S rRNA-/tRNA-specific pseudouridylate synthase
MGVGVEALSSGRVFVNGRRAERRDARLRAGDVIDVSAPDGRTRPPYGEVHVLGERDGCIAVDKPAGLSTEPDREGALSVVTIVAQNTGKKASELHAATRLDRTVSGVVLIAASRIARRRLAELSAERRLRSFYVALSARRPDPPNGVWDRPIAAGGRPAREARTRYECVQSLASCSLLRLEPSTGRTHQLRRHAADAKCPLLGDPRYGGPYRFVQSDGSVWELRRVALHRAALHIDDPKAPWRVTSPVPAELVAAWVRLGGVERDIVELARSEP